MRTLDEEQVRSLLETARGERLEALYVLALITGMRQGEPWGLPWKHVDLMAGVVRVCQSDILTTGGYKCGRPEMNDLT